MTVVVLKRRRCREEAGVRTRIRLAMQFLAVISGPRVRQDVFVKRWALCHAPCKYLRQVGDKSYCGACGCGKWRLAELATKLWFANLACPVGQF